MKTMKTMKFFLIPILALVFLTSCCGNQVANQAKVSTVLSQEGQAALTPDRVIEMLKQGNRNFVNDTPTLRDNPALVQDAAGGQYPMAVILSCLDSRVPVELIFDKAIGDLFVARVAGNIANVDILGSMEFATAAMNSRVIVVLGHSACGAVVHAIKGTELGNITEMLSKIQPAVACANLSFTGETSPENVDFVEYVTHRNVALTIEKIRAQSEIIRDLEASGAIRIVGAYYDLNTGIVSFLN